MSKSKTNFNVNGKDYVRTTYRYTDENGKSIQKVFYGKTKKEANEKKTEFIAQYKYGLAQKSELEIKKETLNDIMHEWLFNIVILEIKPSSFERYEGFHRNYVKDSNISNMLLHNIETKDMQLFFNTVYKTKNSATLVKNLYSFVNKFFNYQLKIESILKNPCKNVTLPKENEIKKQIEIFTPEEIEIFKKGYEDNFDYFIFYFALATGMRQGEILALSTSDIDLDNLTINVNKTINRVNTYENGKKVRKDLIYPPKSKNSIRTLPIANQIVEPLKKQIELQQSKDLDLLFTNQLDTLYNGDKLYQKYMRFLKRHDIKPRKFHTLRHTYCSILHKNGVSAKTASELMGHSIDMTLNIYTHLSLEDKRVAVTNLSF